MGEKAKRGKRWGGKRGKGKKAKREMQGSKIFLIE